MDFIDGWFGSIFYTDKESKLHVKGLVDEAYVRSPPLTLLLPEPTAELNESLVAFFQRGYFVVSSAISDEIIREARVYINDHYRSWVKQSKRQDDWRCHLMVDLTAQEGPVEHPAVLNLLLRSPRLIQHIEAVTQSTITGIFYSQVAFRTPLPPKQLPAGEVAVVVPDYQTGAEYHLDGQANASGTRFPDPWSILVGIALVDIVTEDKGNFTVFPGWHTQRDWSNYPDEKRTKTLPNLGTPTHVCLRAGDAIIAHVMLPHRGGKNTVAPSTTDAAAASAASENTASSGLPAPWNIPANTREMVFIRVRVAGVPYESPQRCAELLSNPMCEFPGAVAAASLCMPSGAVAE